MSDRDGSDPPASPPIDDAVEAVLGALLRDRDVTEIQCLEGGFLQVIRRGRRERLDAVLEGPLFALVREEGGEEGVVRRRLRSGHRLIAGPCVDGRQALRVEKAAALDVDLDALVEEQLLPPGLPEELAAAAAAHGGVVVIGPSRAGRQRVAAAVARVAQRTLALAALSDNAAPLFPAPSGVDIGARARAADALGFDALFALELDPSECAPLLRAPLTLPLIASVRVASMEALLHHLGGASGGAIAPLTCVIGVSPDGRPRLTEVHGAIEEGAAATNAPLAPGDALDARARPAGGPAAASADDAPSAPLAALPPAWASQEPDDDPGWELAGLPPEAHLAAPPAAGSFDDVLARQAVRPSFQPRTPQPHPQAARLQGPGNPFGGLTFEPPRAPAGTEQPSDVDPGSDEEPG